MPTKKKARKATKKKASSKSKKKVLVCATGSDCFWVHDGPILKDIRDLNKALSKMSEEMFSYHVSGKRNDFANWVENVLSDRALATRLRRAKRVRTAANAVAKRLKEYKK